MAKDPVETILLVGLIGAGGYVAYEYYQYNNAFTILGNALTSSGSSAATVSSAIASAQATLPFFTFLQFQMMGASSGTSSQQSLYSSMLAALGGTVSTSTGTTSPAPGTTSSTSTTSTNVTTTPSSTSSGSSATPQQTGQSSTTSPTTNPTMVALAAQMQQTIGMTTASADQWDYAFQKIMGQPIDQKYGFNFDTVYGPIVNGARSSGQMSAMGFLLTAAAAVPGGLPGMSGFGTISRFPGPKYTTVGNMITSLQHPLPYALSYNLRGFRGGMGAFTAPTGFERALWAGRRLTR